LPQLGGIHRNARITAAKSDGDIDRSEGIVNPVEAPQCLDVCVYCGGNGEQVVWHGHLSVDPEGVGPSET
jgi:hypothetical protein